MNRKIVYFFGRAFTSGELKTHEILVWGDIVRVYDEVSGYYTTCHALTEKDKGRILAAKDQSTI